MTNPKWRDYEEVAAHLLNQFSEHFNLTRVEGKQTLPGKLTDTSWTIDAKGVLEGGDAFVIVECRRHTTSKQDQEQLAGLAYRIRDTGAEGAIVVSPLGFQSGAEKVAKAERIVHVELHPDSTAEEFSMRFLNQLFVGMHERCSVSEECMAVLSRPCATCGKVFTVCADETVCGSCRGLCDAL